MMCAEQIQKMCHVKLPITLYLTEEVETTIHNIKIYETSEWEEDSIGELLISDNITNKKETYNIWFDDNGEHYICLPTYQEDEEELEIFLLSDLLNNLQRKNAEKSDLNLKVAKLLETLEQLDSCGYLDPCQIETLENTKKTLIHEVKQILNRNYT